MAWRVSDGSSAFTRNEFADGSIWLIWADPISLDHLFWTIFQRKLWNDSLLIKRYIIKRYVDWIIGGEKV